MIDFEKPYTSKKCKHNYSNAIMGYIKANNGKLCRINGQGSMVQSVRFLDALIMLVCRICILTRMCKEGYARRLQEMRRMTRIVFLLMRIKYCEVVK
jgi:tRNA U38,U39,U40 pseudouridine synthase TruA